MPRNKQSRLYMSNMSYFIDLQSLVVNFLLDEMIIKLVGNKVINVNNQIIHENIDIIV